MNPELCRAFKGANCSNYNQKAAMGTRKKHNPAAS